MPDVVLVTVFVERLPRDGTTVYRKRLRNGSLALDFR